MALYLMIPPESETVPATVFVFRASADVWTGRIPTSGSSGPRGIPARDLSTHYTYKPRFFRFPVRASCNGQGSVLGMPASFS